jgi:hypothetical protein
VTLEILAKLIVHTDAIHPTIAIVKDRRLISHEDYYTKTHEALPGAISNDRLTATLGSPPVQEFPGSGVASGWHNAAAISSNGVELIPALTNPAGS